MSGARLALPRWPLTLRGRLVLIISGIVFLILLGETLVSLASEVTSLHHTVSSEGTILAQGVATAVSGILDGENPRRFDDVLARVRRRVDLVELAIVDRNGRVVGHSDPARVGEAWPGPAFSMFGRPLASPGLPGLLGGELEYTVTTPIVRGTVPQGFVVLRFRSERVAERAGWHLRSAAAMGLLWLAVGAAVGTLYVRRITRPLADLTRAAREVTEGKLEDVRLEPSAAPDEVGVLQTSFARLLAALRTQKAENEWLLSELRTANEHLEERVAEMTANLRETAAYLQSVLRCMEEGVITCDREGEIVQANRGAEVQLQGLGKPEPGRPIAGVLPEGEPLAAAVRKALATRTSVTLSLVRAGGDGAAAPAASRRAAGPGGAADRHILFRVYPLEGLNDRPLGAVVTVFDETERTRVESRLRRHERLVSMGTMAAGLAHELGNYMHAIKGYATLLLRSTGEDDPRQKDVQSLHDENARATVLLDRFLQFARPGEGRFQPEPVGALVREALAICALKLRQAGVTVVDEIGSEDREVRCDGHLLTQVFVNLALNAADALAGRPERRLTVSLRAPAEGRIEVLFRDTGAGIAPEHIDRIFDPFFTTKGAAGTGLGLAIAHQIVDRHEGTIGVESTVGAGTTFTVSLPVGGPKGAP